MTKHFMVNVKWHHRKTGPQTNTMRAEGSNMLLAAKRAFDEWRKGLTSLERRDVAKGIMMTVMPIEGIKGRQKDEAVQEREA
jgi:hypothetical protein